MLTTSLLTGEKCNLLGALWSSKEDLIKTVKLRRWWQNTTGTCNAGRCAGACAANAIFNGTYLVDQENSTEYHARFKEFFTRVQQEDQICAAGVMCVKGDRSKGPTQQRNPNLYLRVVEKNNRGIVVRGAKAHMSNGALAHEILVMPWRALGENEKDYAVSFAVPNGAKGLIHIWQYNLHDSRRLLGDDPGSRLFGLEYHGTCLTIFNDIFIPWERVFLCGEHQYTGVFVEKFADLVRLCGGGCRPGALDLAIGTMALRNPGDLRKKRIGGLPFGCGGSPTGWRLPSRRIKKNLRYGKRPEDRVPDLPLFSEKALAGSPALRCW
ncbi:MAG: 4-hydroxyphenylacetate 3-hydroxylase N-terminal domain-containing protein [Bacillota bacterium]